MVISKFRPLEMNKVKEAAGRVDRTIKTATAKVKC